MGGKELSGRYEGLGLSGMRIKSPQSEGPLKAKAEKAKLAGSCTRKYTPTEEETPLFQSRETRKLHRESATYKTSAPKIFITIKRAGKERKRSRRKGGETQADRSRT